MGKLYIDGKFAGYVEPPPELVNSVEWEGDGYVEPEFLTLAGWAFERSVNAWAQYHKLGPWSVPSGIH